MTDKEKLDATRVEIHRLVDVRGYDRGMANDLFAFMDSLPNEPVINDLEEAARAYYDKNKPLIPHELDLHKEMISFFVAGAQWRKQQDQSTIELAEDHAMLAGMEKMKEEMIDKFFKWLAKHWREYVWLDNNVIHFGHWEYDFRRAMEE